MIRSLVVVAVFAVLSCIVVMAQAEAELPAMEIELESPVMFGGPEPNCGGDIGLVYGACNPKRPELGGCGYAQYNARYTDKTGKLAPVLTVVNAKSAICNDSNTGGKGRSAVAYNWATRVEFFHTGTGSNVYTILASSGAQVVFAQIPNNHDTLIGLELLGSLLYLVTPSTYYTAQVSPKFNTTKTMFQGPSVFPADLKLSDDSFVTSNGKDTFYMFSSDLGQIITYNLTSQVSKGVPVDVDAVTQLFYSAEAGLIMAADGFLYRVNPVDGTSVDLKAPLPVNAAGATLSTTNYYAANSTHMMAFNTKTATLIKYTLIAGAPIIGNFVYIR